MTHRNFSGSRTVVALMGLAMIGVLLATPHIHAQPPKSTL